MLKKGDSFYNNGKLITESEFKDGVEFVNNTFKKKFGLSQILGKSQTIKEIQKKIEKISECDANVLITGESGTGKELAARGIHYLSNKAGKPFIPVNCSAIPESLFENELFGHVKGAFTDAKLQQFGLVKESEGGTLFLDEIDGISPYIQAKLLRLIQDKEYKILGDPKLHRADIRIIAATNRDLQDLIKKGKFREDLFYRINIVSLVIPPLRERREDIPLLVEYFFYKYSREYNKVIKEVKGDIMKAFNSYSWPGNIRELENIIQHIIVMSDNSVISEENIPSSFIERNTEKYKLEFFNIAKRCVISSFEKSYLIQLLRENRGNMVAASKMAGKSRTALWNLLKKHSLSPKPFRL